MASMMRRILNNLRVEQPRKPGRSRGGKTRMYVGGRRPLERKRTVAYLQRVYGK